MTQRRALLRFIGVTFALGCALQAGAVLAGLESGGAKAFLLAAMWAPALGALAAGGEVRARALSAARRRAGRWLPVGILLGLAPLLLQKALLVASGAWVWDSKHFELAPDGGSIAGVHKLGMALGVWEQGFGFFAVNLACTLAIGAFVNALLGAFGEELGWRGVLQPELERRFGPLRATLATGAIWAYWHLPANLAGFNDAAHPLVSALLVFPLGVVGMSFGLAWITRRTRSVWPAAVAHGANNALNAAFPVGPSGWTADTLTSLLAMAAVVALVVYVDRRRRTTGDGAVGSAVDGAAQVGA
jgi:membrane protease YdiL (CAAX protease family)